MHNSASFQLLTFASSLREGLKASPHFVSSVLQKWRNDKASISDIYAWYADTYSTSERIELKHIEKATKRIEETLALGIHGLSIIDHQYPQALKAIENPPPTIYLRGNLGVLNHVPGLAIVGTRKASKNGLIIAERLASHFSSRGWLIVSGLALGIDAAAHRGALHSSGSTIAVLAHGLDAAYPKANANLANEIIERGGAWVSEYPVGVHAKPEQFVFRNRIQIGLSAGSVIVEGEVKSGSMTQAEFCLKNSRELFTVLEPKGHERLALVDAGPKVLRGRGAHPIFSRDDYIQVEKILEVKRASLLAHYDE
ncbi:MAG: DNA-processing protein DprA [Oxalobacter sp.]|nr:MAG: DNA-processing protein DprA [Oxalobacter sp.]